MTSTSPQAVSGSQPSKDETQDVIYASSSNLDLKSQIYAPGPSNRANRSPPKVRHHLPEQNSAQKPDGNTLVTIKAHRDTAAAAPQAVALTAAAVPAEDLVIVDGVAQDQAVVKSSYLSTYLTLLQQYQDKTAPTKFVYLKRVPAHVAEYNPYILRVVSYQKANKDELYTLSAEGVNQYRNNVHTEFTPLDQWQREEYLVAVRGVCSELTSTRLQQLTEGQVQRLPDFLAGQQIKHEQSAKDLDTFGGMVIGAIAAACHAALEQLETQLLQDTHTPLAELSHTGTSHGQKQHLLLPQQHQDSAEEFKFTLAAARRTELRRLRNFVKMADYMMCDTLQQVLAASVVDMLQAGIHQPHPEAPGKSAATPGLVQSGFEGARTGNTQPSSQASGAASLLADGAGPSRTSSLPQSADPGPESPPERSCIFEVEVVLTATGTKLTPSISQFLRALEALVSDWMGVLSGLRRLWEAGEVMRLITTPGDEHPPHTPLAALIDAGNFRTLVAQLQQSWQAAFAQADSFRQSYAPFEDMLQRNDSVNVSALAAAYVESFNAQLLPDEHALEAGAAQDQPAGEWPAQADSHSISADAASEGADKQCLGAAVTLPTFKDLVDDLRSQLKDINGLDDKRDVGMFRVDAQQLKAALLPSPTALLMQLGQLLPQAAAQLYSRFVEQIHSATSILRATTSSVEDYANQSKLEEHYSQVQATYELVLGYDMQVPAMDMAAYRTLTADMEALQQAVEMVEARSEDLTEAFGRELAAGADVVIKEAAQMRNAAQAEMVLDEISEGDAVICYLSELVQRAESQQAEQQRIVQHQTFLNLPRMVNEELGLAKAEIELRLLVWTSSSEWAEASTTWAQTPFTLLDVSSLEDCTAKFAKSVLRMERSLPSNQVVTKLGQAVKAMQSNLPLLQALRNPALKDRHWTKLANIMGTPLVTDPPLTLAQLLDLKVEQHQEAVVTFSVEASQEAALEDLLDHINSKWNSIDFTLLPFKDMKDSFILGSLEDVTAALEDSMVTMFMTGIRHEVERIDRQLHLFSDTLDEWTACQKDWMYLKTIFSASDIQRQLPHEAKAFTAVDKQFKDVMRRTKERSNAMQAATAPGLLDAFRKSNEVLETISKSLEDYLETKRMAFPRFYFLSNDELLEILAQPHLGKCFDGIRRLEFGGDDPKSPDILAMVSAEGEKVPLGKSLKARGNIETWLSQVEQSMAVCLRKLARAGHQTYPSQARTQWVTQQPSQLVLLISQCLSAPSPPAALAQYLLTCTAQLGGLTRVVRGTLPDLHRRTLSALITIDVHARDIVDNLIREGVQDANEFAWQMQLRYSWNEAVDDVVVRQVNSRFIYGYEYVGAQGRLVVTPMTDRCYITLTAALHHKLGASPAGPAGTGKTETTKACA
ncbi:hypothetical protein ABBQ32_013793 [Trebouxia sp. C0010 RCD-2024]